MKILVVCQYFWPETFRINDLCAKLVARGHEVEVFTGLPNYPQGDFFEGYGWSGPYTEKKNGIEIKRVPILPRGRGKGWQLALNYLSFVFTGTFGIFGRVKRPDVILVYQLSPVTQAIPAILYGKLKRIPVLFYVQDLWPDSLVATGVTRNPWVLGAVSKLVGWLYRSSELILTQSRSFIEAVKKYGIAENKIRYFPNTAEDFYVPVSMDVRPAPVQREAGSFHVMFAGNIGKAQDFSTTLSAAEKLKMYRYIHFVVIGDGRERAWMQSEIVRRGLSTSFHWIESQPSHAMPGFLAHADALLVTLKNEAPFAQTIPSKIQSYLACEKPIIANLPGEGARVVVESGSGVSVEPENAEALATAILEMSQRPKAELQAMGRRGGEYFAREFSAGTLVTRFEGWMKEVTAPTFRS